MVINTGLTFFTDPCAILPQDAVSSWLFAQAVHAKMTFCQIFFAVVNERKRPVLDAFQSAVTQSPDESSDRSDRTLVETYQALMQRCWADEPAERPSFTAILTELSAMKGIARKQSAGKDSAHGSLSSV